MRLFTAIAWFFKILFKGRKAFFDAPSPEGGPAFHHSKEPAIQLLALFQKEGRLIDFLQEDIANFSDAQIGAAARDIHGGCRKVLNEHVTLVRIFPESEGSAVEVSEGYDPSAIDVQGNVPGNPPFKGTLRHGGWYVEEMKLPTVPAGANAKVAAAAQVEVAG